MSENAVEVKCGTVKEALQELSRYKSRHVREAVEVLATYIEPTLEKQESREALEERGRRKTWTYADPMNLVFRLQNDLSAVIPMYNDAEDTYMYYTGEIQDLLHLLELSVTLPKEEYAMIAERIRLARIERRKAKDVSELIKPLYQVCLNADKLIKNINQAKAEMHKIDDKKEARTYSPRTDVLSLPEYLEHAQFVETQ